jgi:hypothetical protein
MIANHNRTPSASRRGAIASILRLRRQMMAEVVSARQPVG